MPGRGVSPQRVGQAGAIGGRPEAGCTTSCDAPPAPVGPPATSQAREVAVLLIGKRPGDRWPPRASRERRSCRP
jgi:hypothetical protein